MHTAQKGQHKAQPRAPHFHWAILDSRKSLNNEIKFGNSVFVVLNFFKMVLPDLNIEYCC